MTQIELITQLYYIHPKHIIIIIGQTLLTNLIKIWTNQNHNESTPFLGALPLYLYPYIITKFSYTSYSMWLGSYATRLSLDGMVDGQLWKLVS